LLLRLSHNPIDRHPLPGHLTSSSFFIRQFCTRGLSRLVLPNHSVFFDLDARRGNSLDPSICIEIASIGIHISAARCFRGHHPTIHARSLTWDPRYVYD
jgi:hypothetical protein